MRASNRTLVAAALALAGVLTFAASPAPAYVPNTLDFVNGQAVVAHWPASAFPLGFRVTPGVTVDVNDGSDLAALNQAMSAWNDVADSSVSLFLERQQDVEANVLDGVNAIEFATDASLEGSQFVALTFLLTEQDGTIVEADLLVNDRAIGFSTDGGDAGLDLQTVMTQQFGKLLGLASSPVGAIVPGQEIDEESAVMFAISRGPGEQARELKADDIAGIAAMYPAGGARGSISGTVVKNGGTVFGAHVLAFDPVSQQLVGAVSLPDGSFTLGGLLPGRYLIDVVPLPQQISPQSFGGIFATGELDTSFRSAFHTETVRLTAGGQVTGITVEVR